MRSSTWPQLGRSCVDKPWHRSAPVRCSPRTNMEAFEAKLLCWGNSQNSFYFLFQLSTPHSLNTLTDCCLHNKNRSGEMLWRTESSYCVMNGHHYVAWPSAIAAFSQHLEGSLSVLLLSALCLFLVSLKWHAWPSVQLPPATIEPANPGPTQPTPADVPEWTLGWRGHGGAEQ